MAYEPQTGPSPKLAFDVAARRIDAHGSSATCKSAAIRLDTDLAGNPDAFNPAELLLAALAACIIKGIERVTPMLHFQLRGLEVRVHGVRQDVPPRLERIDYEIVVDTDEVDARLALLHENVKKYGTVFNTVAPGTSLQGVLHRGPARTTPDPPDDPGPVIRLNESQQRHLAVFLQQLDRGLAEVEQLATAPPSRAILRIEQDDLPPDYAASIRDDLHELRERIHALVHRLELQPSERSRRRRTLALLLTMTVQLEDAGSSGLRGYGPVDASVPTHLDPALAAMRTALQRMGAVLEGTGPASGTPPPLNP